MMFLHRLHRLRAKVTPVWFGVCLMIPPFGSVTELLQKNNPWKGAQEDSSVLWLVRIQRVSSEKNCAQGMSALLRSTVEEKSSIPSTQLDLKRWGPWSAEDLEPIQGCDEFPCGVKFDALEVAKMAVTQEDRRLEKFENLVLERVKAYQVSPKKKAYEFSSVPIDPWGILEKKGYFPLDAKISRPNLAFLSVRKLEFGKGQLHTIRQVIDRRVDQKPLGTSLTVWLRDVYTNHYFESWGEWTHLQCDQGREDRGFTLVQVLILECDELKKESLLVKIMSGRIKSEMETQGLRYLDQFFDRFLEVLRGK